MKESEMFVKTEEAEAVEQLQKMEPLEVIKAAAEGIGLILNDPKPNCKKCYGRGYLGVNSLTKEPIPCSCIFPKYESQRPQDQMLPQNRKERRAAMKKISNSTAKKLLDIEKKSEEKSEQKE